MNALRRLLLAVVLNALRPLGRRTARGVARALPGPRRPEPVADRPIEEETLSRETGGPAWAEVTVAALMLAAAAAFVAFAVLVVVHPQTQLLGGLAGGGLAAVAGALILAGLLVVPQEQVAERRTGRPHADHQRGLVQDLRQGTEGVSRRKLLTAAAGTAGVALGGAAAAVPLTAIGPGPGVLDASPWAAGTRLVDEDGEPLRASALQVGSFATAFPEGADQRELGSPVVVVRVDPATLDLPAGREGWAPGGIMAYSKVCTHAGCAVSLFRHPVDEEHSSPPALQCPCHYSTFDVRRGCKVTFGPAGRPLPQLPLRVDGEGRLVAAGKLSGSVGPAWWGSERA